MMSLTVYFLVLLVLLVYSFGFVDSHLELSSGSLYQWFHQPIAHLVNQERVLSGTIFIGLIVILFFFYIRILRRKNISLIFGITPLFFIVSTSAVLFLSYPAFSYDIFNYILTAKLTYFYNENPYLVMPIEIPNEATLVFTRAANKLALYGPTWIGLTFVPHVLGRGEIWQTILWFKATIIVFYFSLLWLIYRVTRDIRSVIYFGLNPLVIIETFVSSHNDIVMMTFALAGCLLWLTKQRKNRLVGLFFLVLSVFVKGATIILLPLFLLTLTRPISKDSFFRKAFWLMLFVFFLSPLREELYPWYAAWFLPFAAVLPWKRGSFIHPFSITLSFGLLLRYLPYLVTNSYGGNGPVLRILFTAAPVLMFLIWYVYKKRFLYRPRNET